MKSVSELFEFEDDDKRYRIYCDLDGVLTDFEKAAKEIDNNIFNKSQKEMWLLIHEKSPEFWEKMSWTKDGVELWRFIKKYGPYILTAIPGKNIPDRNKAIKGKEKWIEVNLGRRTLFKFIPTVSSKKKKYANSKSILIDDREDLIEQWIKKGGIGIHHISSENTIKKLKEILNK